MSYSFILLLKKEQFGFMWKWNGMEQNSHVGATVTLNPAYSNIFCLWAWVAGASSDEIILVAVFWKCF